MREFQAKNGTLYRLGPPAKLLYLSFLALTLLGFASSLALYYDSMGLTPASASVWYGGNESDPDAVAIVLAKSPRELLEVSHFHLFTVPVSMLVLGHLFLLSRGGAWRLWVAGAAPVLTLAHVAGPWIVWWAGPGLGWWMPVTGAPFLAVYVIMAVWPIPDLLWFRPDANTASAPAPHA
jgi:hypothetical protein